MGGVSGGVSGRGEWEGFSSYHFCQQTLWAGEVFLFVEYISVCDFMARIIGYRYVQVV